MRALAQAHAEDHAKLVRDLQQAGLEASLDSRESFLALTESSFASMLEALDDSAEILRCASCSLSTPVVQSM